MDRGVVDFGGRGSPVVLAHALMGCARTWRAQSEWLRAYGHVYGVDAAGHGENPRRGSYSTELFVDELTAVVERVGQGSPVTLVGHSMGGLHALGLAARRPELVERLVVEEMAVDLTDRSVDDWLPLFATWPDTFDSIAHVREFFGPAGDYFAECVEECAEGYRMITALDDALQIATEWCGRAYWSFVDQVRCPVLYLEAEHSLMPAGQIAEMAGLTAHAAHVTVPGAAHLAHGDAPEFYRGAVEAFLSA